jgi:hypothetical protein
MRNLGSWIFSRLQVIKFYYNDVLLYYSLIFTVGLEPRIIKYCLTFMRYLEQSQHTKYLVCQIGLEFRQTTMSHTVLS